ncbi:hypothetical protein E3Z27_18595 [Pseudomonas mediterranea]|uniref:hypothetical protein n=1 Tax=Pseudomonas mediterranea TaxID=183795 RepID=UPI001316027D|nr:hypothetical protein [Pseudomonas mediterranea]QHA83545.1 hypothetical protein E3Z27_18595 [Pseudomonas mediterranea]
MCGKKIKKLVNKVVDLDPLRGGDVILEGMGLPNLTGENTGFLNKAEREKAAAEAASGSSNTASTTAPTTSSDSVQAAIDAERRRRLAQSGQNGTILTGASGLLGGATTGQKTLLGV